MSTVTQNNFSRDETLSTFLVSPTGIEPVTFGSNSDDLPGRPLTIVIFTYKMKKIDSFLGPVGDGGWG